MNILQEILKSKDGQVVSQLAKQFGIDPADAAKALSNLIPAVAGGIKKTARSPSGLESLISKVETRDDVKRAIDIPQTLENKQSTSNGNDILAEIFGSKDVSRTVANQTAKSTGLDFGMLKKMLPLVAGLVMSSMNKKGSQSGGGLGGLLEALNPPKQQASGGLGSLLGSLFGRSKQQKQSYGLESLLDFDGDGNVADDVLDLAKKLF